MQFWDVVEKLGKTLAVLSVVLGAIVAVVAGWMALEGRAEDLEEELTRTRGVHKEDMQRAQAVDAKIAEWIEAAEEQQIREDANLRALCASKKLTAGAAYCQTRGYPWGID
jgi:predicted Holliday junction resolvase-like endonuclease